MKLANNMSSSKQGAQLQTHRAFSAECSWAMWAPFFPGFL